jgi:membrane-bound serine protease (ClpP class)
MSVVVAILLLGLGLAFIVAEVLFPSLGLLSLLATACIVGALAVAFSDSTSTGLNFLIAVAVLVPVVMLIGFKLFPRSPMGRKMVAPGLSFDARATTDERDGALLGREGTVESALRPSGIARIDGRRVDVVTRGELVDPPARVRVIEVTGNRVVVAAVDAPAAASPSTPVPPAAPPAARPPTEESA